MNKQDALELAAITLEVMDKELDKSRKQTEEARWWAIHYQKKYEYGRELLITICGGRRIKMSNTEDTFWSDANIFWKQRTKEWMERTKELRDQTMKFIGERDDARKWAIYYKKKYEEAQANHDLWVEDVFYKENDE